jgi:hypothetical protein
VKTGLRGDLIFMTVALIAVTVELVGLAVGVAFARAAAADE